MNELRAMQINFVLLTVLNINKNLICFLQVCGYF